MCDNWEEIVKRLPPSLTMLSSVVSICAGGFTRREQLDKVQSFFRDKDTKVLYFLNFLPDRDVFTNATFARDLIDRSSRPSMVFEQKTVGCREMQRM